MQNDIIQNYYVIDQAANNVQDNGNNRINNNNPPNSPENQEIANRSQVEFNLDLSQGRVRVEEEERRGDMSPRMADRDGSAEMNRL